MCACGFEGFGVWEPWGCGVLEVIMIVVLKIGDAVDCFRICTGESDGVEM